MSVKEITDMPTLEFNIGYGQKRKFTFVWGVVSNPDEIFMVDNARATIKVNIQYGDRLDFIEAVTGFSYISVEGGRRVLRRLTPWEYPYKQGIYCVGCPRATGLSPYGTAPGYKLKFPLLADKIPTDTQGQPNYLTTDLSLLFTNLPYKIQDDNYVKSTDVSYGIGLPDEGDAIARGLKRFVTRIGKPAGKLITLPGNYLYYKKSGRPIPHSSATFFQPAMDIVYTWFGIPEDALPIEAWLSIPGTVNRDTFDGFPPETLLCQQPTFKTTTSVFGIQQCDVTYTFRFLPNFYQSAEDAAFGNEGSARGHNWFPTVGQPSLGGYPEDTDEIGSLIYREVCTRGSTATQNLGAGKIVPIVPLTGDPVYRKTDFRPLFRPRQTAPVIPNL